MSCDLQLKFPLKEFLPLEERIAWAERAQEADREELRKSNKKLFMELGEMKKDNKELRFLITQLVDLLSKSQF